MSLRELPFMSSVEPPPVRRRGRWKLMVGIGIGGIMVLLITSIAVLPGPMVMARTLGFCPVDKDHVSPKGTNTIRVLITDGGATGYGGIFVYQRTGFGRFGHEALWKHAPAVAIPDSHTVKWHSEREFTVSVEDPNKPDPVENRIALE